MSAFCPPPALFRRGWLKVLLGMAAGMVAPKPGFLVQAADRGAPKNGLSPLTIRVSRPLDAETPVSKFTSFLTPNQLFFVRSHFGPPPSEALEDRNGR